MTPAAVLAPERLPRSLYFFPDYSAGNPFQAMLHARLEDVGATAEPVADLVHHLVSRAEAADDPGILNLHWTSPILGAAEGPFRARLLLDRFTEALDGFLAAGGRLIWTVHNVLPHETRRRWAEIELAQVVADRADMIHVLSERTVDAIGGLYRLDPAKIVLIPHSSYLGYYPDSVSREDARAALGIDPEDKVMLALGGVRAYKGLGGLLDVLDDLARSDPALRLLIAGRADQSPETTRLRERCAGHERVIAHFEHVPDDQVQVWAKAADIAVLAYRDILNSGAFLLAQTFGLPVVAPRAGALGAWEGLPHITLFDPQDPRTLASAVLEGLAAALRDPEGQHAQARAVALSLAPTTMAVAYAEAIRPWLSPRAGGRPG